jgi:hypothetical protein
VSNILDIYNTLIRIERNNHIAKTEGNTELLIINAFQTPEH